MTRGDFVSYMTSRIFPTTQLALHPNRLPINASSASSFSAPPLLLLLGQTAQGPLPGAQDVLEDHAAGELLAKHGLREVNDQLEQGMWQIARRLGGNSQGRQSRAHIGLRRGSEHAGLADLRHVGGHEARLDALDEDAVLLVLRLQVVAEFVDKGLQKSRGINKNFNVKRAFTSP